VVGWVWVGGWEEKLIIRLNSAQFKLKLLVGADLGKRIPSVNRII
jgi:hypothetical protein